MVNHAQSLLTPCIGQGVAYPFATHNISASRLVDVTQTFLGSSISVTTTMVNHEASSLRGFYFADRIPAGLVVAASAVKVNGQEVTDYHYESETSSVPYSGEILDRFILEGPFTFGLDSPIVGSGSVEITYLLSATQEGSYNLNGFHWVGYLEGPAVGAFGYSEAGDVVTLTFTTVTQTPSLTISETATLTETPSVTITQTSTDSNTPTEMLTPTVTLTSRPTATSTLDFPNWIWVDFANSSEGDGTYDNPYNNLTEATIAVTEGGSLRIKVGSTTERPRITKALRLESVYGPVRIGGAVSQMAAKMGLPTSASVLAPEPTGPLSNLFDAPELLKILENLREDKARMQNLFDLSRCWMQEVKN